jgi:alanyl-tRNA synthetase
MTTEEIRSKFLQFFIDRGHTIIPRANLVPAEDATTLFTGSGMQPLIPFLLGQKHPQGTKLADSQPAFRAEDIDEVGDNRHTTLFEMLGNWSLGEYFKKEQIPWMFEFLTDVVGLDPSKIYVTCFIGAPEFNIPKDTEAARIWKRLFEAKNIEAKEVEIGSEDDGYRRGMQDGRIFYYGDKNWWNRGKPSPQTTPVGDPCGPDSEMFYDFGPQHSIHENSDFKDKLCHVNCDCGRYMEIGNNVFMAYRKESEGKFIPLSSPNIDQGSGLERIAAAAIDSPDMFKISVLWPIIEKLQELSGFDYAEQTNAMRIIADHLRAATFLAVDGVVPSNTAQGYVMRRFIRRAIRQALVLDLREDFMDSIVPVITGLYRDAFPEVKERENEVMDVLMREETQFRTTLERGIREFEKRADDKLEQLTGRLVFELFDTYGFPHELSLEEADRLNIKVAPNWQEEFSNLMAEQKKRSRTATVGQFKGGLADHSEMSTKYHTATHLVYKALRLVLGDHVIQRGSNITPERLRFDFSHPQKMTPEEIKEVERIVNENIARDWPMGWREEDTQEALKRGVLGAFGHKYGETVKVYTAGDPEGEWYSQEICGGPHVEHTGVLGNFKITKEEASSAGIRRIKAVLE